MANEIKKNKVENKVTDKLENKNLEDIVKKQQEELKRLSNQYAETLKMLSSFAINSNNNNKRDDVYRAIRVYSLLPNKLYLSTEDRGKGTVYEFDYVGDFKDIPYGDLIKITSSNRGSIEKKHFYIADKDFVKERGLSAYYKDILEPNKLLTFMENDNDKIKELLDDISDEQFQNLIELVIDDLYKEKKQYDGYKLFLLQNEYEYRNNKKIDIMEKVEFLKSRNGKTKKTKKRTKNK